MSLDPTTLWTEHSRLEEIEKATLRLVVQGLYDYRALAKEIFAGESDKAQDIAEDITRESLDRLGMSGMPVRLFGKVDYKRARYVFHPEYSIRQALFVDSKAEKVSGQGTANDSDGTNFYASATVPLR